MIASRKISSCIQEPGSIPVKYESTLLRPVARWFRTPPSWAADRNNVGALLFLSRTACNALVEDDNLDMNQFAASEKITGLLQ